MKRIEKIAALITLLSFFAALGVTLSAQGRRERREVQIETVALTETHEAPPSEDLININTAGVDELCTLSGIGPVLAQRIVDYREKYGGFSSIADIIDVNGIGFATFEKIRNHITV